MSHAASDTDEYCVTDLDVFPAGDDLFLVHTKTNHKRCFLRSAVVELLAQCRDFHTLEAHIDAYGHERRLDVHAMGYLQRELRRLAQGGFLISRRGLLQELRSPVVEPPPPPIGSVGFPTCDRVEILQRGLSSYVTNCRCFGHSNSFVVVDDSPSPDIRTAYRQMLQEVRSRFGVEIFYAGREEKTSFAKRLVEAGTLPQDIVAFALLGDRQYGTTAVGANRNALLLHSIGEMVFSADDDTVCSIAATPGSASDIMLTSEGNPLETWFFPDRDTALRSVQFADHDIIALHEQWLGRYPRSCLADDTDADEILFDRVEPRLLDGLVTRPARVAVTLNGSVGDCAWDNPHYRLFQRDETFARLARLTKQEYASARLSREVLQAASRVTMTDRPDPLFAMCMAIDNRGVLPPFPPVGRAEDVAFGTILRKCFDTVYTVHLPYVVPHLPPQPRAFPSRPMFAVGPDTWLPSVIGLFDPGFARNPMERLAKLGQYLEELGSLPPDAFDEFLQLHMWQSMSALISGLESRLEHAETTKMLAAGSRPVSSMRASEVANREGLARHTSRTSGRTVET